MSEQNNKEGAAIYNYLCKEHPSLFPSLRKVPGPVPNPGEMPKPPERSRDEKRTFSVSEPIGNITSWLESLDGKIYKQNMSIDREVVRTIQHNNDWDDEWYDAWEEKIYGPPISITISCSLTPSNINELDREYRAQVSEWRNRIEQRKKRNKKIQEAKSFNHMLMHEARKKHMALWIAAGRYLKGVNDPEFAEKKIAALQEQIELLKSTLPG
jgi:hypothetical protein